MTLFRTVSALLGALSMNLAMTALAPAQNAYPECPEPELEEMLDDLVDAAPKVAGNVWQTPSANMVVNVETGIYWMVHGNATSARRRFQRAGMDACLAMTDGKTKPGDAIVVYDPDGRVKATAVGLPVLVYRPNVTQQVGTLPRVVMSIPHAVTESHLADDLTVEAMNGARDDQGRFAVRAAVISTVHRCHSDTELTTPPYAGEVDVDGCDGWTRLSDDAHNPESLFQVMHGELRRQFWDDQVAQIHGAGDDFPGISVSNGSGEQYTGPELDNPSHAVVRWYDELTAQFGHPEHFTICHQYTPIPGRTRIDDYYGEEDRRCGTRNATRGEDPRLPVDQGSGTPGSPQRRYHFLHLEINSDLKELDDDRAKFVNSLGRILSDD